MHFNPVCCVWLALPRRHAQTGSLWIATQQVGSEWCWPGSCISLLLVSTSLLACKTVLMIVFNRACYRGKVIQPEKNLFISPWLSCRKIHHQLSWLKSLGDKVGDRKNKETRSVLALRKERKRSASIWRLVFRRLKKMKEKLLFHEWYNKWKRYFIYTQNVLNNKVLSSRPAERE